MAPDPAHDLLCARLLAGLIPLANYQAWQNRRLLRTSKRICAKYGAINQAQDVAQDALVRALERGEDLWEWSTSALRYILLDQLRNERHRLNREMRWATNRRPSDGAKPGDSIGSKAELIKGRSLRWVGHEKPKKACELCGLMFDAVDATGVANKRKRFCSRSCSGKFARGSKSAPVLA